MSHSGRNAVVTGAGGGIGLAIATALARDGCVVTAVDLKARPGALPDACAYVGADITASGVPQRVVDEATRERPLDYLVNAAGVGWFDRDGEVARMDDAVWDAVLAINLTAPMRFARAAAAPMRDGGAMVHIASIAGLRGSDDPLSAYQVSKAGLVSLSRALAIQLASREIRSNTICPGAIETPMVASIYTEDPSRRERMAARTPIGRLGTAADIASACLYLLGDEAAFVTGTDHVVDGGWLSVLP